MMIEVAPLSAVARQNVKKLAMQAKMSFLRKKMPDAGRKAQPSGTPFFGGRQLPDE